MRLLRSASVAPSVLFALGAACLVVACSTDAEVSDDHENVEQTSDEPGITPEASCEACHPNHVREWRMSAHAYAMRDPVFHAMVRLGQAETDGAADQFCVGCHSPIGVDDGETEIYFDDELGVTQQRTEGLSPAAMAGVSCDVCHSITSFDEILTFNANFEMTRDGVRRATILRPVESSAHESAFSSMHGESDFCGTCHDVVSEFFTQRIMLESTLTEWEQSIFPGQKSCQDCHMQEYDDHAAIGGPERKVHRHSFVGVDVSLLPPEEFPGYDEMRELTTQLLQESAELSIVALPEERALSLLIKNLAGHALPTGATVDREMWVELKVKNGAGEVVFSSGTLDERGDLRVDEAKYTTEPGTDRQLVLYHQEMYFDPKLEDPASTEPRRRVDFLWEPNTMENQLIRAGGRDEPRYELGDLPAGDYVADVRLLFRTFPPHLLRKLEEDAGLDPAVKDRVPIVEMETASVSFTLP